MTARTYSLDEILEARGRLAHLEATDIDDVTWLAQIATLLDLTLTEGNAIVTREQTNFLKYRALGWEPGDVAELATIVAPAEAAAGIRRDRRTEDPMDAAKDSEVDVALNLSKLLVHEDDADHVREIVSRYATTAKYLYRSNTGTERWDMTWLGETYEARKAALQRAIDALEDHYDTVSSRP